MDQNKNAQGMPRANAKSQQNRVHQPSGTGAEQYSGNRGGHSENEEQGAGKEGGINSSRENPDRKDDSDPARRSER